jgi:lysophospholipase L1-like esterase
MKKIIVSTLIVILIVIIYNIFKDNKIYYVSISNISDNYTYKDYIKDYLDELDILEDYIDISSMDDRITDIIRNINDNKVYGDKTFQNILIKADLLTLSIGYNDLISKIDKYSIYNMYSYIDTFLIDLDNLFNVLRQFDKEKIVMLGYYNPYDNKYNEIIKYINLKVEELAKKYNIEYVDIADITKYIEDQYISIEGEHIIFDRIRCIIDDNIKRK